MDRLSTAILPALPADVARPAYDRAKVTSGIVHLGIGAFHRAHQAWYAEQALAAGDLRWGITAVSLRSSGVRDQMAPQNGLYTLATRDGGDERLAVIGAVHRVLVAPEDPQAVVAAMADAACHIVSLTVTEKGYKLDPATGALIADDPDLAADMASLERPRTAPGLIVAALARRRAEGLMPFTAISCDNLPHNGARLAAAVTTLARAHDPALADWIERHGAFPQTMVDRIVPATTDADVAALAVRIGVEDRAMVKTEPFSQWVIEDRFAGERPDFEGVGVQVTPAVAPWEDAKLRLLNGAHSAIAYLGGLAGVEFVHEMVAQTPVRAFVERLWDEAAATLTPPPGLDVAAYRGDLIARFANPALGHRTRQIAMDGSQKLPQRLLAPIAERRARGLEVEALALGVAAWMKWQGGRDDAGAAFVVDDPLAAVTAARLAGLTDPGERVAALLSIAAVFPAELAADAVFRAVLTRQLAALDARGGLGVL
ncbi:mannitol dehydrogenase family protein [Sphingomonas donggukensis]|uniref:Mannitol dehydrogenase family protein n=1 Tax=Sphingomonas donggukensis TaxID=2949093 RepID=A0ABY4TTQ4_9SPHN|nr:mannitol dehydrogenase family protein [Sphingomonas donggukensis]URW75785.1 mannitol dehydrogenase family protein [Sphingomonas donggukensis]